MDKRRLREHARKEILQYAKGHCNARTADAYAFTLNNGYLYSGEYMWMGETVDYDHYDGYVYLRTEDIHLLDEGDEVTIGLNPMKVRKNEI